MAREFRQNLTWYRMVQWVCRTVFRAFFGLRYQGVENIPQVGPVIIAPVHLSFLDPPLVGCVVPRPMRFMAKEELFKPILGPLIRSVGTFPVLRGKGDTGALRTARATLEAGGVLLVFPEGTRNDGETLNPLQPGVLLLAEKTGAQIVPVGISGTELALPKGGKGLRRARLSLAFGRPFLVADIQVTGKALRAAFASELSDRLVEASRAAGLPLKIPAAQKAQVLDDPA
jgi:1-acyl-sn-glycerol-3-phosphate acyltransferase